MKVIVNNFEKEEVIDWSKVQLVISKDDNKRLVLVSLNMKPENEQQFTGIELSTGIFYETWFKSMFTVFHNSITLQND